MKITVKDYYAIKRGNARSAKLNKEERIKIATKAVKARWERYKKEDEEDKKYRRTIVK